jgi:hypothetical protein
VEASRPARKHRKENRQSCTTPGTVPDVAVLLGIARTNRDALLVSTQPLSPVSVRGVEVGKNTPRVIQPKQSHPNGLSGQRAQVVCSTSTPRSTSDTQSTLV